MTITIERYQNKENEKEYAQIYVNKVGKAYNLVIYTTTENGLAYPTFEGVYSTTEKARRAIKRRGTWEKIYDIKNT